MAETAQSIPDDFFDWKKAEEDMRKPIPMTSKRELKGPFQDIFPYITLGRNALGDVVIGRAPEPELEQTEESLSWRNQNLN